MPSSHEGTRTGTEGAECRKHVVQEAELVDISCSSRFFVSQTTEACYHHAVIAVTLHIPNLNWTNFRSLQYTTAHAENVQYLQYATIKVEDSFVYVLHEVTGRPNIGIHCRKQPY